MSNGEMGELRPACGGGVNKLNMQLVMMAVVMAVAAAAAEVPVLQWWAPWMKDAKETPASYNKKNRPWWFSAEVTSYRGYGGIKYAGQMTRDHLHNVF